MATGDVGDKTGAGFGTTGEVSATAAAVGLTATGELGVTACCVGLDVALRLTALVGAFCAFAMASSNSSSSP